MRVIVTGSSGLIGSEAVRYFAERKARVYGIDNNMRADFIGPDGDTTWTQPFGGGESFLNHLITIVKR